MSSDSSASPPSASKSCDCVVFLLPSFMPVPLKAGVRSADGAGEVETTRTAHDAPPLLDEDAESIVAWLADGN